MNEGIDYINKNNSLFDNGYFFDMHQLSGITDPYGQIPLNLDFTLISFDWVHTINSTILIDKLIELCGLTKNQAYVIVHYFIENAERLTSIKQIKTEKMVIVDRDTIVSENLHSYADSGNTHKTQLI